MDYNSYYLNQALGNKVFSTDQKDKDQPKKIEPPDQSKEKVETKSTIKTPNKSKNYVILKKRSKPDIFDK
jgi:hypothetical protein